MANLNKLATTSAETKHLLKPADGCFDILDLNIFDYCKNKENKKSFIVDVDLKYPSKMNNRDDDYPLALKV